MTLLYKCVCVRVRACIPRARMCMCVAYVVWCGIVQCMYVVFVHSCKWLAFFSHSPTIFLSPYYMATPPKRHFGSQTPFFV